MISTERQLLYDQLCNIPIKLYEFSKIQIPGKNRIFALEEWLNPTASMFDRVYPVLFRYLEDQGYILPGITPLIEVSTGNAGASFARCAQILGYTDYTVITHADTPKSRVQQIQEYGAKIEYSPAGQYAKGYVEMLEKKLAEDKKMKGGKFGQNPNRLTCVTKVKPIAKDVYKDLIARVLRKMMSEYGIEPDYHFGVVGSGTSMSGCGEYYKENHLTTKSIVVDAEQMPTTYSLKYKHEVLDYANSQHNIYGASPFGLPVEKLNIDLEVFDEVIVVSQEQFKSAEILLHDVELKPVGRTSSLTLGGILKYIKEKNIESSNFLMFLYDAAWKYEETYPYIK